METLHLPPVSLASGHVTLPGSKSISNRTLLLAALATGTTEIYDLLASDDTSRMLEALQALGIILENFAENAWRVKGCGGIFNVKQADLFLGNALNQVGADIQYIGNEGFPPLKISPAKLDFSHTIQIRGDVSSQFLTALLIALPLTKQQATIEVVGELISKPYIAITLNLMAKFGVAVQHENWQRFTIAGNSAYVSPQQIFVEGDASSASYFLAAGAIAGEVEVKGIGKDSIQGDVRFAEAIAMMGAQIKYGDNSISACKACQLKSIDMDCNHIPDAAMTLAVMALFANGTTILRNIASWRVKETDRIAAMATELRKLGAIVEEGADYIKITPPAQLIPNVVINTYDDHRMAMCFSLVSFGSVPITINDPKCVNKTFPDYFISFSDIAHP